MRNSSCSGDQDLNLRRSVPEALPGLNSQSETSVCSAAIVEDVRIPRAHRAAIWRVVQEERVAGEKWTLDGDLDPDDVVEPRLQAADPIIVLDLPAYLSAWRVLRRSREGLDFWCPKPDQPRRLGRAS